ncbi:membrane-bound lytic murein transglycosylase D precursor [Psychrobacter sp. JCM 18901]|nr:membrane-bound lytic murein transglycosylase D precursor [Psychrobacter sp. JCM 18901]
MNQSSTYDGRRDVIESTRAAYDFLTALHNQFGSWELALAAYNAGPGRVQKAIDANAARGLPTDYWSLQLPTETMNYVPRFLAVAEIVAKPEQYGVYLPAIANRQHFRSVPVNYGVSLAEVSQLTGVSYDELERLNTALTSGRVDSSGPQRVIIPNDVSLNADAKLSGSEVTVQAMYSPQTTQVAQARQRLRQAIITNPILPHHYRLLVVHWLIMPLAQVYLSRLPAISHHLRRQLAARYTVAILQLVLSHH